MRTKVKRILESKRGIAVIMAMWLLAVLAIIGTTFAYMMRLEPMIARHHRDEVKAMYVAQAGLDKAYALLKEGSTILELNENLTDTDGAVVGRYEVTIHGVFLFTFRGNSDGTDKEFYRYNAHEDEWLTKKYAPGEINAGGALAWGGGGYVYGLRGGTSDYLYRYKLSKNNWKKKTSIPGNVDWGGALVHWYEYDATDDEYDHYLYALQGGDSQGFYLYDIDANSWTAKANTPEAVSFGGALTWVADEESAYSDYIYATRGGDYSHFYLYDIDANNWYSKAYAPDTIGEGGALAWTGGYSIYATRGGDYSDFYLYDIDDNNWYSKADAPDTIGAGGSLVWGGRDYIYALRGSSTNTFWRYKTSDNEWNPNPGNRPAISGGVPATTPDTIGAGGSLTRSGDLYWIDSIGYVPDSTNPRAKKKIEAIVDTSVTAIVDNRIIYWKEIPED